MLRAFSLTLGMLFLASGLALADKDKAVKDQGIQGQPVEATVTNVDRENQAITVKIKDKNGQETEKVFKLTAGIKMLDSSGNAAQIGIFRSGDQVLVIEREGKLTELKKGGRVNEQKLERNPFDQKPLDRVPVPDHDRP